MTIEKEGTSGILKRVDLDLPIRQVRAWFRERTVRVYQAFAPEIAGKAVAAQTFVPPFKRDRMTWIKPSFAWMMYRSGWGMKPGQERILGIDMLRRGFECALAKSAVAHFDAALHGSRVEWEVALRASPVRVQWDPERSLSLEALPWRTIQVGLSGDAVDAYLDEWIVNVEDITTFALEVRNAVREGNLDLAQTLAPTEMPYPLPYDVFRRIDCTMEPG